MESLNLHTLRRVAGIGLGVVLLVDTIASWRAHGGWILGFVMLVVFPIAIGVVSLLLMPRATGALVRNLDLLVPLGLLIVMEQLLDWVAAVPGLAALLRASQPVRIFGIGLSLSVVFFLSVALNVAYATWTTSALLNLVEAGERDPCRSLPLLAGRFLRVLGLESLGHGVVMLGTAILLMLMPVFGFFVLGLMLAFGVAWNFATAAVLPLAFERGMAFWPGFRNGIAVSLGQFRKWWPLIVAQMLLLGALFFFYRSHGGNTNVSWNVNVFWTGGYEAGCRWYGKLAEMFKTPTLPLVETYLTLLFGAFAVAIKLAILQRLKRD